MHWVFVGLCIGIGLMLSRFLVMLIITAWREILLLVGVVVVILMWAYLKV